MTTLRSFTGAGGTSTTEPTGATSGDRLLIHAVSFSGGAVGLPTGWTSLANATFNGFTIAWGTIVRGATAPSYTCSGTNVVDAFCFVGNTFTPTAVIGATPGGVSGSLGKAGTTDYYIASLVAHNSNASSATVSSTQLTTGFFTTMGSGSNAAAEVGGNVSSGSLSWASTQSLSSGAQSLVGASPSLATTVTKTATFDAALANRQTLTATLDAVFATRTAKTATFDAAMANPTLKTALLDAVLASRVLKTATFDADFMKTQTLTALLDAVFALRQNKTATFDAVLAQHPVLTAVFDGVFASVGTKTALMDAVFALVGVKTATFDADLSKQMFLTAVFDAVLGDPLLPMAGRVNGLPPVGAGRAFGPGVPSTGVVTGAQPPASGRVVPHVPGL